MNEICLNQVFDTYHRLGHRHYGESVTELEHALQCATFAQQAGESPVVVAACLLHDYGHLAHELGEDIADRGVDARHEVLGAKLLGNWFIEPIVAAARLHVDAKRYLCWKESSYFEQLSPASRQSLELQGGRMNDEQAKAFEADPNYEIAVKVRRFDDMGKVANMKTGDLESFRSTLSSCLRG